MPETRQDKIEAIITDYTFIEGIPWSVDCHEAHVGGIVSAAVAIAALPVDRVEAMALFIQCGWTDNLTPYYEVPSRDGVGRYVFMDSESAKCFYTTRGRQCSVHNDCDHIRAVKLYLARRAEEQG